MKLVQISTQEIIWDLDFKPRQKWPDLLPVIACEASSGKLVAVAGFERKETVEVLVIDLPVLEALNQLWPEEKMGSLERLRFFKILGKPHPMEFLLNWPLDFQQFLDGRGLPLKNLKPLEYLSDWKSEIAREILGLNLTSSEVREAFDLLCDLKLTGHTWAEIIPLSLGRLKALRNPKTISSDSAQSETVDKISWPRGVQAKWERRGDRAGVTIQANIATHGEWLKLKASLEKLEIRESLWP